MTLARRSFLKALPFAPAAARQAAGTAAGELAGLSALGDVGQRAVSASHSLGFNNPSYLDPRFLEFVKAVNCEDWLRTDLYRKAKGAARILDPDIASMRSWSNGAKLRRQRYRYVETSLNNCEHAGTESTVWKRFSDWLQRTS